MKKIFLYLILFTTFSSAFSFDIWQSKITINKAISIAKSNNLPLHKSTLSAVSKGFQKKLLFLKEYPNNRLFQYHTVLLDKKATVYLYFTKDTKKLYKLKIRWSERGNEFVKSIYTLLDKKYAHKKVTVSKSYVYNIIKANNYEIIKQRKELKNRIPKPIPKNLIWSMDLSTIKEQQIFGLIDNGSRALISLQYLKDKSTINIIRAILNTIELYGKPKIIKSDNEHVFTSKLMRITLYLLGIKQQTTDIASPWQNGKIERLFLTMKQSFQDIIFPTSQSLEIGLKEFRFFYNHIRPHQHLNYRTPNEAWENKPMATSKTYEALYFTALCGNVAGFYYRE